MSAHGLRRRVRDRLNAEYPYLVTDERIDEAVRAAMVPEGVSQNAKYDKWTDRVVTRATADLIAALDIRPVGP